MSTERRIRPAPKPSAKSKTAKPPQDATKEPAKDDALEGVVTYTDEYLQEHPEKQAELLEAPDGTPGKDVAVRVSRAATIVEAAVKDAQDWQQIHERAGTVTRALAEKLVALRQLYVNAGGDPDMVGTSQEYKHAAATIFARAGLSDEDTQRLRTATRWHTGTLVREVLRGPDFANGDEEKFKELCKRYGLNAPSLAEAQKDKTLLPALRLPPGDASKLWHGSARYARKALDMPGGADLSALSDDDRETLRYEMRVLRDRAAEILDSLGDV